MVMLLKSKALNRDLTNESEKYLVYLGHKGNTTTEHMKKKS